MWFWVCRQEKKLVSLFFYVADEGGNSMKISVDSQHTQVATGSSMPPEVGGWELHAKGQVMREPFFLKAWHLPKAQNICPAARNGIKAVRSGIAVKYQMSKTHQFLFTCTVQKGAGVSFVGRHRQHMHNLTQLVWQELEMQVLIDLFLELQAVIVPWDGAVPFSFTC